MNMRCDKCDEKLQLVGSNKVLSCYLCIKCEDKKYHNNCQHIVRKKIHYISETGHESLRDQCTNCGYVFPNQLSRKKYTGVVNPFDSELYQQYNDHCNEYQKFIQEANLILKNRWFDAHDEYLRSVEWRTIRDKVLARDKFLCQSCLENRATQVHHLTYENWKKEHAFELISICETCHTRIHA